LKTKQLYVVSVVLETTAFLSKSASADTKMVSSHFYLNESTEIITSRNFRHGRRTEGKGEPLIYPIVRPNKERFNVRFFIWIVSFLFSFFFCNVLYFIWKGIIIVWAWFFFGEKREKIRYEKEKSNLQLCPCHHKLLIVIMKELRLGEEDAVRGANLQDCLLHGPAEYHVNIAP
jgi:hypothetical protein